MSLSVSKRGADSIDIALLGAPTPPEEVKKRPGPTGVELSYVDARYVQDRFDTAVGPWNWQRIHSTDQNGNVICGIGVLVRFPDDSTEWVWKWDVGVESTIESVKGQYSDSFKRAAVNWGVARDLYDAASEARIATASAPRPAGVARPAGPPAGPARFADPNPDADWLCPLHGTRRVVPAGVSKAGRDYPAFAVCSERDCEERPPSARRPRGSAPARTPAPAFVGMTDEAEPFA